jgi:hypothetical protein
METGGCVCSKRNPTVPAWIWTVCNTQFATEMQPIKIRSFRQELDGRNGMLLIVDNGHSLIMDSVKPFGLFRGLPFNKPFNGLRLSAESAAETIWTAQLSRTEPATKLLDDLADRIAEDGVRQIVLTYLCFPSG